MLNRNSNVLPRIVVIDDLYGRVVAGQANPEREDFCLQFGVRDAGADESARNSRQKVRQPIAEAVFLRGQTPAAAGTGAVVENDIEGTLAAVSKGAEKGAWALALVDLSFSTGHVTTRSEERLAPGMPEGRAGDDEAGSYFGLKLISALRERFPDLPVVILSGRERGPVSREFSELGALAFLPKGGRESMRLLQDVLFRHGLVPDEEGQIVGTSTALLKVLRIARRLGPMRHNLLLLGERGVGKDLLARYLHRIYRSRVKSEAPLVILNSSLLSAELFASELFGIAERTATGVGRRSGLVLEANGGDLFIDEIKDAPPIVQAGLLRVLEERRITPVGGRKSIPVDVRFISATNGDLDALCESGHFRSDLHDRLREGGALHLPSLRERKEDIPLLAETFIRSAEATIHGCQRREITPDALELLLSQPWPGNIRELRQRLYQAVAAHPDVEHLVPAHLELDMPRAQTKSPPPTAQIALARPAWVEGDSPLSLDDALALLRRVRFASEEVASWSGALDRIERAQQDLLARCLEAALRVTLKRTPENPEGSVQIHPATKLLTGDTSLTASKAADLVKRLLKPRADELHGLLAEAYAISVRLRPKNPLAAARTVSRRKS
jgi:DNA-binding NtrC family response regulator